MDFSENYRHCKFNYGLATKISIFFGKMVSTPYSAGGRI